MFYKLFNIVKMNSNLNNFNRLKLNLLNKKSLFNKQLLAILNCKNSIGLLNFYICLNNNEKYFEL